VFPAFYWDSTCPTGVAASVSCGFPKSDIILPPIIDPSVANGTLVVTEPKNGATQPRYQNWSLSVQHQFSENMLLDLNYAGDHGTRLVNNWTTAGGLANMLDHGVLSTYGPNLLTTSVTDPAAQAAGTKVPYLGFTGDVAQALRMWPQYQGIRYRDVPNGMSIYHALQVTFERRMTAGFQFRLAYTWSKLINNGAEAGQADQIGGQFGGNAMQNPVNQKAERSLSVDDVPQYLGLAWIYELPFGRGKRWGSNTGGAAERIIGGWKISATQIYQSGRPLQISMNNDIGNYIFNAGKRPNKVGPG